MVDHATLLRCDFGPVARSSGSATFTQRDTSVIASVNGPSEVRMNRELVDRASLEVYFQPKSGLSGCRHKSAEVLIQTCCSSLIIDSLYPRQGVNIAVQEVHDGDMLLACAVNAAILALLDAAIPMYSLAAAVSCCLCTSNDESSSTHTQDSEISIIIDPTSDDLENSCATFTFVFASAKECKDLEVIAMTSDGLFTSAQLQKCRTSCQPAAKEKLTFLRSCMEKKLKPFT